MKEERSHMTVLYHFWLDQNEDTWSRLANQIPPETGIQETFSQYLKLAILISTRWAEFIRWPEEQEKLIYREKKSKVTMLSRERRQIHPHGFPDPSLYASPDGCPEPSLFHLMFHVTFYVLTTIFPFLLKLAQLESLIYPVLTVICWTPELSQVLSLVLEKMGEQQGQTHFLIPWSNRFCCHPEHQG